MSEPIRVEWVSSSGWPAMPPTPPTPLQVHLLRPCQELAQSERWCTACWGVVGRCEHMNKDAS